MANATVATSVLASSVSALSYAAGPAVAVGKGAVFVVKGGAWVVSLFKPTWAAAFLLGSYVSKNAAERKARLKFKSEALAKLADANAETLKLLIDELPTWVSYPDYDRVTWLNTMLYQIWPSIDEFVREIVEQSVGPILQGVQKKVKALGIKKIEIKHFSLGKPPKITGIKAWNAGEQTDSVVLDMELRLAGSDPNIVVAIELIVGGAELVVQVADLQLTAKVRVILGPLVGKVPGFGAVSVSILGYPFLDFSLVALSGDLMAIPGLEDMVGNGVRGAVSGFVWPRRMVIPIVAGTDVGPLQARPSGVFIVRVVKAKDLISVDMSFGRSIDPYFRLHVDGQPESSFGRTKTIENNKNPTYNEIIILPVVDPAIQGIHVDLWDANKNGDDEKVGTGTLWPGNAFEPGARGFVRGTVQLRNCRKIGGSGEDGGGGGARAGLAQGAKMVTRGLTVAASAATLGVVKSETKEEASKAGTVIIEVTFCPLLPFNSKPWVPPPLQPPKPGSPEAAAAEAVAEAAAKEEAERKAAEEVEKKAAAEAAAKALAGAPPKQKLHHHLNRLKTMVAPPPAAAPPPKTKEELEEEAREQAYVNIMDHLCKVIPPHPDWAAKRFPHPGVLCVRVMAAHDLFKGPSYPERPEPFVSFYVFEGRKRLEGSRRQTKPSNGLSPTWNESFEICNLELKDTYHLNFMVYLGQKASGIGAAVGNAASMAANVVGGTINLATKVGTLGAVSLDRKAKEGELHSGTGGIMGRNQDATTAFALPDEDFGSNFAGRKTVQLMDIARDCEAKGQPVTYELVLDDVTASRLAIVAEWRVAAYRDLDAFRQERAAAHAQAEHAAAEAAEGGRKIAFEDGAQGSRGDLAAEGGAGGSRTSNTGQGEGSHSHQAGAAAGHGKIQLLHARSAKRLSTHAEHAGGFHHAHEEEESEEDDEPQMPRGMFACFSAGSGTPRKHHTPTQEKKRH